MGLKSGSRNAGLDDDEGTQDERKTTSTEEEDGGRQAPQERGEATAGAEEYSGTESTAEADSTEGRPAMSSIPYKLRREKVNEGREQVPYFLRDEVIDAESELQETLEDLLGEDVYKSDYREASMVVAQRNPELVADVLREWGYDLDQ